MEKVKADDDVGAWDVTHNLNITMKVSLQRDGKNSGRDFNYSTSFVLKDSNYEREVIESLLLKFIVAIDKFIDTEFEVQ